MKDYDGWKIVIIGEDDSLLLESPRGDRRRVLFREREFKMLESKVEILSQALRDIVKHQELIGGGLAVLSTTRIIAQNALEATES